MLRKEGAGMGGQREKERRKEGVQRSTELVQVAKLLINSASRRHHDMKTQYQQNYET